MGKWSNYATYLGDSVYVEVEPTGMVKLTTNNGYPDDPRNVIYMEPGVVEAFDMWLTRLKAVYAQQREDEGPVNGPNPDDITDDDLDEPDPDVGHGSYKDKLENPEGY